MAHHSVSVNVHVSRRPGCLGALILSPYYGVKFMVLALIGVCWLYGTIGWYLFHAAAALCRTIAAAWDAHRAGTLRSAATLTAMWQAATRPVPAPPWQRRATGRRRITAGRR